MYSPAVNTRQIQIANKIFQQKYPEHKLVYHSEEDVLTWREHLESIRGKDGTFTRDLTVEEDRWITNERMVCKVNHLYALRRYSYIVDRNKKLSLFKPNLAQQIILATLGEMEEQRLELVLQFVKARRLGVSTVFELLIALRILFDKNINSIISASNPEDTDVLSRMCLLAIERFPFWMRPLSTHLKDSIGRFKQGLFYEFHFGTKEDSARNRIDLEHGTQFADIGRSQGPTANHLCLAPSTLIPVGGGIVKPISEIVPGDEVLTSTGAKTAVRHVFKSSRRNEITSEILLWGQFNPLSCTRDHPILTPDGFRPAHTLRSSDYVTMPVRRITGSPTKFEFPVRERGWKGKHGIAFVNTDKHLGWLLGLYMAEGSLQFNRRNNEKERRANSIYFTIHQKEVEAFKAKLQKAVPAAHIGLGSRISSLTRHLRMGHSGLARWVGREFGHTDGKRLPDWVWNCGEEFCKAIVAGYLEGDGHIPVGGNEIRATSVRLQILIQIRDLIASLGYGWSGIYFKPEGQHYDRNCQDAWTLSVAGPANENIRKAMGWPMPDKASAPALHWYYSKDKRSVNIQIYRTADGYCEEFYDLEVAAPEHDFCTIHCCVHNSEIAKYSNPASLIDAGLMKAMIPSPMNLCCLEGTSEGPVGYWPEKYDFNKKNYGIPGSGARMKPTFLPWFVGVEIYPTETDLITKGWYQVCDTWEPEQKTIDHASAARKYVLSDPMLKRFLAKGQDDWQMSREQMFFFEADIKEYRKNNNLHIWLREMAPDDRSCWAAGEKSVFNADMLMQYRASTAVPLAVFGLKGMCGTDEIVAKRHHVLGALHKQKSLKVTADWTKRYAPFEFEFYPVKFTGWNGFDETGKIIIFEWPKPGETYALAADNADGRGGDSSVLKVLRKGGMGRCDAEAASFASSGISGTELWPWTLALGTLYSVMRDGKLQQPMFIPEINREGGGQLVKEMDYRGWKNFYRERRGRATSRGKGTVMLGWHMNEQNRSELILRGIQAIEDEWIEINSPAVVDEMDVFIRHTNGRIGAARHRHDDHIISLFLAFWALYHEQARGSGPDPAIQRTRVVSDTALFPLCTDDIGSQISRHIDEMISERGWSLS